MLEFSVVVTIGLLQFSVVVGLGSLQLFVIVNENMLQFKKHHWDLMEADVAQPYYIIAQDPLR